MPSMKIPESAYPAIQNLIRLITADFDAFLEALSQATPVLDQEKFWSHVASHIPQVEQSVIKSIVTEVLEMATACSVMDFGVDDLVSAIASAASEKPQKFPFTETD